MREAEAYKPPLEAADKGRRLAGTWHFVFVITTVAMIVMAFLLSNWAPTRRAFMIDVGILGALGTISVGALVHTLDALRGAYRDLLYDYIGTREEGSKRERFMMYFTPPPEEVERVLASSAYLVLARHREIAALHEKGVSAPEAENPDAQLATLKQDFERKLSGLEILMRGDLDRFRELRDIAKWAGEKRFNVRESWWDYIDPKDMPKNVKRKRTAKEASDPWDDFLLDPIGQPAGRSEPAMPSQATTEVQQAAE